MSVPCPFPISLLQAALLSPSGASELVAGIPLPPAVHSFFPLPDYSSQPGYPLFSPAARAFLGLTLSTGTGQD